MIIGNGIYRENYTIILMKSKILLAVLLVLGTVVASGCVTAGAGRLVLQITDQPDLGIEKAEVTISNVQVHIATEGNETGWMTVVEEAKTFDLVAIKDVEAYLGESVLEAGKYTQIRLDVESAKVTINGTDYNLTIPSRTVKLIKNFDIEENKTTTLTLDFDAEESVHEAGTGNYVMRPTIKVLSSDEVKVKAEGWCTDSGGTVTTTPCCLQAKDFPDTCLIGACGCSLENSHEIRTCDCGEGKCFNGKKCVEI